MARELGQAGKELTQLQLYVALVYTAPAQGEVQEGRDRGGA